jgi:hypothetical protein
MEDKKMNEESEDQTGTSPQDMHMEGSPRMQVAVISRKTRTAVYVKPWGGV